jgi:hypothetical protein
MTTVSGALSRRGLPGILAEWDPADWRTPALVDRLGRRKAALWHRVVDLRATIGESQQALAELGLSQVETPQLTQDELAHMIRAGEGLHEFLVGGGSQGD